MANSVQGATNRVKAVDWAAIEGDYRSGVKSVRQIGRENLMSAPAILKAAKRNGWERDLAPAIRARAKAKVNRDAVNTKVNTQTGVNEKAVIEANSDLQASVVRGNRADIARAGKIVTDLLAELGAATISAAELDAWCAHAAKDQTAGVDEAKRDKAFDKALATFLKLVNLPSRAATVKTLTDALKTKIALERQAFGIDEQVSPDSSLVAALKELHGMG